MVAVRTLKVSLPQYVEEKDKNEGAAGKVVARTLKVEPGSPWLCLGLLPQAGPRPFSGAVGQLKYWGRCR